MSLRDFEMARSRLERAQQDMHWVLAVLDDPASTLKEYDLTQDEVEKLFHECHGRMAEMHTTLTQAGNRVSIKPPPPIVGPIEDF